MKRKRTKTRESRTRPHPSKAEGVRANLATVAAFDNQALNGTGESDAIPEAWEDRAKLAWDQYVSVGLVKTCINTWRTFAVGEEIKFTSNDEDLKGAATTMAQRLSLNGFVKDMILQLLVKGDAIGFKRYTQDLTDIDELVLVNPISVKIKTVEGELHEVTQQSDGNDPLNLPVENVLHLKWDAPKYSPRGNSMVLPALPDIELLKAYKSAERAIAKRWATPFRMVKVGGNYNGKLIMPDQKMLNDMSRMINQMDQRSGLTVPFYVNVETQGAEGQVLNIEEKLKGVKEDICVSLGLSRALIAGDGPNFATASVSLEKMLTMISEIKQVGKRILDWVFQDWHERQGYGKDQTVQYLFNDLDPSDAIDFKKLLLDLYDRGLISSSTLQLKFDLDPDVEQANLETKGVNLLDAKQTQPIVEMVNAGILDIPMARDILGIPQKGEGA